MLVAAVTTTVRLAAALGNVSVDAGIAGLTQDSVVDVTQLATVDRSCLDELIGVLPVGLVEQLDDGLRLALELSLDRGVALRTFS